MPRVRFSESLWLARTGLVSLSGLMFDPAAALANAGTPLMWASMLHLSVDNLLIGIFEGLLLGTFFRVTRNRAIGWMIVANYVSAGVGVCLLSWADPLLAAIDLHTVRYAVWTMLMIAWLLTLVVEWPFVVWMCPGPARIRRSLLATLVIQTASYLLMSAGYWWIGSGSLLSEISIVTVREMSLPSGLRVFYIADADRHLHQLDVTTGDDRLVQKLESIGELAWIEPLSPMKQARPFDREMAAHTSGGSIRFVVHASPARQDDEVSQPVPIPPLSAAEWDAEPPDVSESPYHYGRQIIQLGTARQSNWQLLCGFWPNPGLVAFPRTAGPARQMSFETPFLQWGTRFPTLLPGDLVIFEFWTSSALGKQICVWDINRRQVALLARGHSPIVILPELLISAPPRTDSRSLELTPVKEPSAAANAEPVPRGQPTEDEPRRYPLTAHSRHRMPPWIPRSIPLHLRPAETTSSVPPVAQVHRLETTAPATELEPPPVELTTVVES